MTNEDILLIAGPEGRDDELVAAAAAHHPQRVTVLIEADDPNWGWSEKRIASTRRPRRRRPRPAAARRSRPQAAPACAIQANRQAN